MALETSGFQLSQLDSAPPIPENIGVVDTKGIYGAVVDALKTNEALRTTQQVQAATDAELGLATQKAQTEMGLLQPEAEARKAKAQLFAAGAPYQQALLPIEDQARRQELTAQIAKNRLLSQPGIAEQAVLGKILTPAEREIRNLSARLNEEGLSEAERNAIMVRLKQAVDANTAAKNELTGSQMVPVKSPDGTTYFVPKYALGSGVAGAGGSTTAPASQLFSGTGPIATAPGGLLASTAPTALGGQTTKMDVERQRLALKSGAAYGAEAPEGSILHTLPGDEAKKAFIQVQNDEKKKAVEEMNAHEAQLSRIDLQAKEDANTMAAIDRMIALVQENGNKLTGGGKLIDKVRQAVGTSENQNFQNQLQGVLSNIKTSAMMKLKAASATGATGFGSLSDPENKSLESTYGGISTASSPEDFIRQLQEVKHRMGEGISEAKALAQANLNRVRDQGINAASLVYGRAAANQMFGLPPPANLPEVPEGVSLFPSAKAMAPAQITLGAPAPAEVAPSPLVPAPEAAPAAPTTSKYEQITPGAPVVPSYPGRAIIPAPAPAPAPAAAPAAPQYSYPVYSAFGAAERINPWETLAVPGRVADVASRYGAAALRGVATGDYTVAEKGPLQLTGEAIGDFASQFIPEEQYKLPPQAAYIAPTRAVYRAPAPAAPAPAAPAPRAYSWEEYNARRRRTQEETGLPQVELSPESVAIAKSNMDRYEAGQRAKRGEPPVMEITGSDGKRRTLVLRDMDMVDQLVALATGERPMDLRPNLEYDREATRQLGEDRMRREELLRQVRTRGRR